MSVTAVTLVQTQIAAIGMCHKGDLNSDGMCFCSILQTVYNKTHIDRNGDVHHHQDRLFSTSNTHGWKTTCGGDDYQVYQFSHSSNGIVASDVSNLSVAAEVFGAYTRIVTLTGASPGEHTYYMLFASGVAGHTSCGAIFIPHRGQVHGWHGCSWGFSNGVLDISQRCHPGPVGDRHGEGPSGSTYGTKAEGRIDTTTHTHAQ